jgi:hypothetical protein
MKTQAVFIEPSSNHFLENRLFDLDNHHLNRDGTLVPFAVLRDHLAKQGVPVHTADKLKNASERCDINHYWSLGLLNGYKQYIGDPGIRLRGFILLEPPLVQPLMYECLPELTEVFEEVYVHNTHGDGYSLNGVDQTRLRKLYWPQPFNDVLSDYWSQTERLNKMVVIAGSHNPGRRKPELYSQRIKAVSELSQYDGIDLFGRGWDRWWSRSSLWWPYWRHHREIMQSYRGPCVSKWETLAQYRFSLCYENMPMSGYVTEKLFDCLYVGTVPIYWGATDIECFLPAGGYIDKRMFNSYQQLYIYISEMSEKKWQEMREVGREFLQTTGNRDFYNSLLNIVSV